MTAMDRYGDTFEEWQKMQYIPHDILIDLEKELQMQYPNAVILGSYVQKCPIADLRNYSKEPSDLYIFGHCPHDIHHKRGKYTTTSDAAKYFTLEYDLCMAVPGIKDAFYSDMDTLLYAKWWEFTGYINNEDYIDLYCMFLKLERDLNRVISISDLPDPVDFIFRAPCSSDVTSNTFAGKPLDREKYSIEITPYTAFQPIGTEPMHEIRVRSL